MEWIPITTYIIYSTVVLVATLKMYQFLTTETERKRYRTKIQRVVDERKYEMIKKAEQTSLEKKLKRAGVPSIINAFRFQVCRWTVISTLCVYYVILPSIDQHSVPMSSLLGVVTLLILSSPSLRFSLTNYLLDQLRLFRERKKHQELFTLFDMLQAELTSLTEGQEINVYNLIRESVPYFQYINHALLKFLYTWKYDPRLAKTQFSTEVGGEDAETLSNILYKIDDTSKEDAIQILKGASKVFSVSYFEGGNRKKEKRFILIDTFFFCVNLLTIAWLLLMIVTMFTDLLETTNL
ncbi:hypothetical protein [Caldalkalibacillus salinus]|uniref:hypothetical protein n=1 Tax=Caldalkalibacillus salinus TaxID=2803787 RepID=UPI001921E716|nr:hypothetical protein [Caldalkalibacillus salinus]